MSYPSTPVDWIPPAPPARGDGRSGRRPAIIDAGRHAGRIQVLSFLAVVLAALVAGLAVFIERGDPPVEQPQRLTIITLAEGPAAEPGLRVQLALPGVGVGAPASVASLAATGQASPETPGGDSGVALTAARYARHLAAGLRSAADAAVVAPQTADAVQVALAIATAPQIIYRIPGDAEDEVLSETALAVRLGLGSQESLPPFFSYEIERGDTLAKIARRFGISPESIIFNNFAIGDGSLLAPGGSLTIPTRDGLVYNVRLGDTLYALIENFAADLDATLDFPGNNLSSPSQIVEGSTILLVGGLRLRRRNRRRLQRRARLRHPQLPLAPRRRAHRLLRLRARQSTGLPHRRRLLRPHRHLRRRGCPRRRHPGRLGGLVRQPRHRRPRRRRAHALRAPQPHRRLPRRDRHPRRPDRLRRQHRPLLGPPTCTSRSSWAAPSSTP